MKIKFYEYSMHSILMCFVPFFLNSGSYQPLSFLCADEIGPRLQISIPQYKDQQKKEAFDYKFFELENRNSLIEGDGVLIKKTSPIDDSYFFYVSNVLIQNQTKYYFELFPPSTLMIQKNGGQFETLACWKN